MTEHPPPSFFFAPEIEQALVASAFQVPERIALIYRELDPLIHITQPHLRHILDAIRLAYTELGSTDFASVIQVLREEGKLAECGGLEGVNSALDQYRYGFSSPQAAEQIIAHYIEMLKTYAASRQGDLPLPIYRFTGGRFQIFNNKLKRRDGDPDVLGTGRLAGRNYELRGWTQSNDSGEEFLQCQLYPKA